MIIPEPAAREVFGAADAGRRPTPMGLQLLTYEEAAREYERYRHLAVGDYVLLRNSKTGRGITAVFDVSEAEGIRDGVRYRYEFGLSSPSELNGWRPRLLLSVRTRRPRREVLLTFPPEAGPVLLESEALFLLAARRPACMPKTSSDVLKLARRGCISLDLRGYTTLTELCLAVGVADSIWPQPAPFA